MGNISSLEVLHWRAVTIATKKCYRHNIKSWLWVFPKKKKSHGFGLVVKVAQIILRSYRNLNFEDIMKSDNLNSIVCKFGVGYGIEKNPVDICYS